MNTVRTAAARHGPFPWSTPLSTSTPITRLSGRRIRQPSRYYKSFSRQKTALQTDSALLPLLFVATSVIGIGVWRFSAASTILNDALSIDPKLIKKFHEADDLIVWKGIFHPALDLAAATIKLRAEEQSISFTPGSETNPRRFDSVRVPSNNPSEDERSYQVANVGGDEDWKFWGVYDGHAGWVTSRVVQSSLANYVAQSIQQSKRASPDISPEAVDQAIKQGFTRLDDEIVLDGLEALSDSVAHAEAISRIAPARAGSCALLAIFDPKNATLRVACTGDSRAVLGRRETPTLGGSLTYTAEALSVDQTGFNELEKERINSAHPNEPKALDEKSGRLLGLAVTRAFGDHRWKWPAESLQKAREFFYGVAARPNYISPPYLTAEPEVTTTKVSKGDFLILATDGLWDHMSSDHAVECVKQWIDKKLSGASMDTLATDYPNVPAKPPPNVFDADGKQTKGSYEYTSTPEHFVVEDGNAATHLVRNALGGSRRELFCSVMSIEPPVSREVRDDITVQVIFFGDVLGAEKAML